jgi:uncharacterized SAM-binding protein YcdF (DUF218 family)
MLLPLTSWYKKLYIFIFFIFFMGIFLVTNLSKAEKMLFTEVQQELKNQDQTQLFKEPEWDGVYVVDNSGNYHELTPITGAKVQKMKGVFTGEKYLSITINPKEVNHVSWNNFKSFFFKGQQLLQEIQINKVKHLQLGKVGAFLVGWPGGDQYQLVDPQVNLYATHMRCKTKLDSSYCEFKDRDLIKKYLGDGGIPFCLSIRAGESPEKGGKIYIVCFEE